MPAAVALPSPTRPVTKVATTKPHAGVAAPKKRRVIRRRGRTRGDLDSDDEIEREAATDSESEEDDLSSLDSATDDSDTEPASEDVIPRDRTHLPTPRNSKSPETVVKEETGRVNGGAESFFAPSGDWSEMVTDEKANGPSELPVIDFADFSGHPAPQKALTRKTKKAPKPNRSSVSRATTAPPAVSEEKDTSVSIEPTEPVPVDPKSASSYPARTSGQSARQAYQHKLETDPSFVPTIGNFWGHDDRLIDTELRSLSGWWRGRGRGRGRGFAMRGRGGAQPPSRSLPDGEDAAHAKEFEVPPIERAWTHDGFEELKRKEEHRRAEQLAARNAQASPKRGNFGAGRGAFVAGRGRGGFARGGFATPGPRNGTQFGRIRFAMKPELMWTKQHEAFLYFDSTLKPRQGQDQGFRVKIPGHSAQIIRTTPTQRETPQASTSKVPSESGSAVGDQSFIVRLPKRAGKEREAPVAEVDVTPIEEVFTVRPQLATAKPPTAPESVQVQLPPSMPVPTTPSVAAVPELPEPAIRSQLEMLTLEPQPADPERVAKTEQAVLRQPAKEAPTDVQAPEVSQPAERPTLPALQTAFSPPPPQPLVQPTPGYGSPYGFHPALPPGLAMDQHGIPYELATGRPVYLQTPAMYNPRPVMPSPYNPGMQFVPGHMHHASAVSPDFLSHSAPHTPPVNGFIDPATGTPIFSFPRQTSRIEIRAPTEESERAAKSSRLRTTAPTFQPSHHASNPSNGYYQQSAHNEDNGHALMEDASQAGMNGMMAYPAYQQTYYYPEPYGYPQYVDMSQGGQYDMYNMDQPPQGTVYY
jgi:hypothetical protein